MTQKTSLTTLEALLPNRGNRAPLADVSKGGYLFGDVDDDDYGDVDAYGDVYDDYGDPSDALAAYDTLIGDAEYGGLNLKNFWHKIPKGVKIGGGILAGAGATYGTAKAAQALIRKARAKHARNMLVKQAMARNNAQGTVAGQIMARRQLGRLPKTTKLGFFQVAGSTLNQAPITGTDYFIADDLKWIMQQQQYQTPFYADVVPGVYSAGTWTINATGLTSTRFYSGLFLIIGVNALQFSPGTIYNITATIPTQAGNLVISATPFSFTLNQGAYTKIGLFPWQLIANKARVVLGQYSNASPITFSITGLPSNAAVTLVVPGTEHPWTIGMRNRFFQ